MLTVNGAQAAPSLPAAPVTVDSIIASISARVKPTYIADVRAFEQAAMKLRGRERLRRLFLVENEIGDFDDTETPRGSGCRRPNTEPKSVS
jgi:hypothetical protein